MAFTARLVALLLAQPLAVALSHNEDVGPSESLLEIGSHRHLQALMANMTVQVALASPPSMPAALQAFVSRQLGRSDEAHAFLQARTSKSTVDLAGMNADQAKKVLNKMVVSTMNKLDLQRAECMSQQAKQAQLVDETSQDVAGLNAQGTNARAQMMATQTAMKRLQDMMPKLNFELSMHEAKCKETAIDLRKQISMIQDDAGLLKKVSGMTSCKLGFLQTGLLHCRSHRGGQRNQSSITFAHPALRRQAAQLKSPTTRQALQAALAEVYHGNRNAKVKSSFLQVARHHHRHGRRGRRAHTRASRNRRHHARKRRQQRRTHAQRHRKMHVALVSEDARTRTASSIASVVNGTSLPPVKVARCAMRSNPDCNTLMDKLMLMQANVLDEVDARKAELALADQECKTASKNLHDQAQAAALKLQEQQEMLAEVTTLTIESGEQSRLKGLQLDHLQAEHKNLAAFCQRTMHQAAWELCKIKSLRQELYKMEKKRPFIQDCEVSAWTEEECSKPCGGGVQNLVRQVVVPDDKGSPCPPLVMQRSCNTQECPKNCQMGEWSGWTSCSAKCGGGVKQRIRRVKQRPRNGGKLCGAETESVGCGVQACDKDCTLAIWSGWSRCSKACGGGFQHRVRKMIAPATGAGRCASDDSEDRLQYKRCNPAACKPKTGGLLKCASKVDVVLLLDGSASLGKEGWDNMKKAGSSIVKALDPNANNGNGAQVAVLLYSGPKDMAGFKKCTGEAGSGKVDPVKDCQMIWVSHFTTSNTAVAASIGNLVWPKGSTMTSQALATAEAELSYGRADAQAVVIAVADRLPMMPKRTGEAAASLRQKGRLIWATSTGQSELPRFAEWASRPAADNIVYMQSLEALSKPETINKIIADACPKVE